MKRYWKPSNSEQIELTIFFQAVESTKLNLLLLISVDFYTPQKLRSADSLLL